MRERFRSDDLQSMYNDIHSSWVSIEKTNSNENDNTYEKGISLNHNASAAFDVDDPFPPLAEEEFGLQYRLHREMMRRHAKNVIRYGGYEKLLAENLDDQSRLEDLNVSSLMKSEPSNTVDNFDLNTLATGKFSRNSHSTVDDSPSLYQNDFAIVDEGGDKDDEDLFAFLLD